MKMETRRARPPMNDGSSTSLMRTTLPSAGAMTTASPRGPVRSGSRKKYATHSAMIVSRKARSQSGHERRLRATAYVPAATRAAMAMKTSPSRAKLTEVRSRVRQGERRPGDAAERVEVATARRVDDLRRKRGRRRLAVPAASLSFSVEIIAQRLLVEAG